MESSISVIAGIIALSALRAGSSEGSPNQEFQDFTEIDSTESLFKALGCTMDARMETKKITIKDCLSKQSAKLVLQAVTMFPNVEHLTIENEGRNDDERHNELEDWSFPKGARLSSSLKTVYLGGIWIPDLSMFENCKELKHLRINDGVMFVSGDPRGYIITNDFSGIKNLPALEELDLTTYPVDIGSLVKGASNHPSLKEIYTETTWFSEEYLPISFILDAGFLFHLNEDSGSIGISMNTIELKRVMERDFKNKENEENIIDLLNNQDDLERIGFTIIGNTDEIRRF